MTAQEKKVYNVEWINNSDGTICLKLNKEVLILKLCEVELLGFNKLWAIIK